MATDDDAGGHETDRLIGAARNVERTLAVSPQLRALRRELMGLPELDGFRQALLGDTFEGLRQQLQRSVGLTEVRQQLLRSINDAGLVDQLSSTSLGLSERWAAAALAPAQKAVDRELAELRATLGGSLPDLRIDPNRLWLSLYQQSLPSDPDDDAPFLDVDDAVPFSEDDLAELAEELRLQMPPGLTPAVMGKLAYCLVMTSLLTSWTAVVIAVPQVGTLLTVTGGGPSLKKFHDLARVVEEAVRTGFAPTSDDDGDDAE